MLCKFIIQAEVIFIVYSEPIKSKHAKITFHNGNTFKMKTQREQIRKPPN